MSALAQNYSDRLVYRSVTVDTTVRSLRDALTNSGKYLPGGLFEIIGFSVNPGAPARLWQDWRQGTTSNRAANGGGDYTDLDAATPNEFEHAGPLDRVSLSTGSGSTTATIVLYLKNPPKDR
jgi:hypothetical protein